MALKYRHVLRLNARTTLTHFIKRSKVQQNAKFHVKTCRHEKILISSLAQKAGQWTIYLNDDITYRNNATVGVGL